jgi:hypothetical protein
MPNLDSFRELDTVKAAGKLDIFSLQPLISVALLRSTSHVC